MNKPSLDEIYSQSSSATNSSSPATQELSDRPSLDQLYQSSLAPTTTSSQEQASPYTVQTTPQKSAVSLQERLFLALGDERGREEYLRNKFPVVQKLENGNFMVGNDARQLQPVDPSGFFGDALGELAEFSAEIPVIAGSIVGGTIGAGTGLATGGTTSVPGAIAGSAIGAGAGEVFKKGIGKAVGVNQQNPTEMATDVVVSSAFGAAGEGANVMLKAAGKNIVPQFFKKVQSRVSPKSADYVAKLFNFTAGVPENKTMNVFKYGPDEVFYKGSGTEPELLKIVDNFGSTIKSTEAKYGGVYGAEKAKLLSTVKAPIETSKIQQSILQNMQEMGLVDAYGLRNPNAPAQDVMAFTKLFNQVGGQIQRGKGVTRLVVDQTAKKPLNDLFMAKNIGNNFYDKSQGRQAKRFLYQAVYGANDSIDKKIVEVASRVPNGKAFLEANDALSRIKTTLDSLEEVGVRPGELVQTENLVKNFTDKSAVLRREMDAFDKIFKTDFSKKMEIWDTAETFRKVKPDIFRFGAVAGLLGFGLSDSAEGKLAGLGVAGLLGTPAGLKTMIKLGSKAGSGIARVAKSTPKADSRSSMQILSSLIRRETQKR